MIGPSTAKSRSPFRRHRAFVLRGARIFRYMLTAVFVIAAIKLPYLNVAAAVIPLFFARRILLWRHAVQRKGG